MAVGRPTKYDPKYCDMVVSHMAQGYSFESFAALADCCVDTLNEWAKVHPSFSAAKKRAFAKAMVYWEKMGNKGCSGELEGFKPASWIYTMKCRFGRLGWMEPPAKIETKNTNTNINIDGVLDSLSPETLAKVKEELAANQDD